MSEYKYCPECNSEFFPHVAECPDCYVTLKTPEELEELRESQRQLAEEDAKKVVAIKQGEKDWILELHHVLVERGYLCSVTVSPSCSPGKCGESFFLLVPKEEAESAINCINEHNYKVHPEIKVSDELTAQGKCPACGFDAGIDAKECPDCGLILVVESQEDM